MKAVKGNKVYTITETEKTFYVKQGFDITDDKGNIIENGAGKKVSFAEYAAVKAENEKLKKDLQALKTENEKLNKELKKDAK